LRRIGAFALLLLAAGIRCASNPNEPDVRVTHDRSAVRNCVGISRVTTEREGEDAERDLKRQTADLGGNVLLLINERSGDAYYCATLPAPEIPTPGLPGPSVPGPGTGRVPTPGSPR
jgi:hypothetical protein